MARQNTVDPSMMGGNQIRNLIPEGYASLALMPQKSYAQPADEDEDDMDDDEEGGHPRNSNRKKHNRRTAKEINRQYICPYKNCQKVYGSEGSLNLHIKIKHNGGNKTDREKLAKTIIMAHMKGHLCQVID